jgi:predicted GIY-YIG superfamily endonuclease
LAVVAFALAASTPPGRCGEPRDRELWARVVKQAFVAVHDGWSADEVLVRDDLNAAFVARCRSRLPTADEAELNWLLLNLRKAGQLDAAATKQATLRHEDYGHAAEIAARQMYDKHQLSIDRVLCDPQLRQEFDRIAHSVTPDASTYELRKAALGLRKARQLRPELVARVAAWKKQVITLSAKETLADPQRVPDTPGIYIFRDASGYLYIGEAEDLRARVTKHLDQSDRKSLARYLWQEEADGVTVELHAFDPDSNARYKEMRRAYESELISSRRPRFNIAP